jgi:hypothetical protein
VPMPKTPCALSRRRHAALAPLPGSPCAPDDRRHHRQPTCIGRTIPQNSAMRAGTRVQFGTSIQEGALSIFSPAWLNRWRSAYVATERPPMSSVMCFGRRR